MFTVYILKSTKTGGYYIGCTNNIERRLTEHNRNKTRSLRNRGPFELIYQENYNALSDGRKRELEIKSYKGGNAFKKLINAVVVQR
ncbi:MAG: Excinuclease abc c subunit domain protein [Candidatus Roizmanbacteria bacterium GW2011_GWA2_35_8]|uniref:Excinuclease abc c subunit domain protein n=1 Tax=Candidatus Roizmanbacteria bacterium GW2011_GWA2_35_8 TaxID=1618479 RepID=A0A0G0G694_9BACT|nr:MAG: Excinuclease abc c subunit domain protein [Candidatus Roizmanbacteria bacterium GW2011_GWA2_35_8]